MTIEFTAAQLQMLRACVLRSRRSASGRAAVQTTKAHELRSRAYTSINPERCHEHASQHETTRIDHLNRAEALKVILGKIDQVLGGYQQATIETLKNAEGSVHLAKADAEDQPENLKEHDPMVCAYCGQPVTEKHWSSSGWWNEWKAGWCCDSCYCGITENNDA